MSSSNHAREIAREAGKLLLNLRAEAQEAGWSAKELAKQGDLQSNELIIRELAVRFPQDAVLSEESPDSGERLLAKRVWIVDPLDGTREYAEGDRSDWAVHVALWAQGDIVAAAVALPVLGEVLATSGSLPTPLAIAGPPRIAVSRTRAPRVAEDVCTVLGGTLIPMGSAGAKAMAVVRGEADAYVHAGGQYEWDSAAPVGVARAAGFHASRLDGSPLCYNDPDPYVPDLLICHPDLAEAVIRAASA